MRIVAPSPPLPRRQDGSDKRREFTIRIVAAAVLIPVAIAAAWLGGVWFAALVAAAGLLMAREWCAIVHGGSPLQFILHGLGVLAAAFLPLLGIMIVLVAIVVLWVASGFEIFASGRPRSFWAFTGVPYIALPVVALVLLRSDPEYGLTAILWVFAVVWMADTLAYAMGRSIGGPKLAPAISPGKTWAGLAGAVAGAAAAAGVVAAAAGLPSVLAVVAVGGLMGVVEQAGDLFESALKRHHELKDSGHLIPGHGGMLDRVDGLVAAAMLAALIGVARAGPDEAAAGVLMW